MLCGSIDFPDDIITALKDDKLVVFAGAGVSMGPPACLKDFKELARKVAEGTNQVQSDKESVDQFLGRLESVGLDVRERIANALNPPNHNPLHSHLIRLFKNASAVRIVTTNFEHLFEAASAQAWGEQFRVYDAPALPLGSKFSGIVHVHGNLSDLESLVVTDADFGRAYLTEGWARRFLLDVFQTYTVIFVGYSHGDTVLSYLARALPPALTPRRYSLVRDTDDQDYWRFLGIEPISFPSHEEDIFFNLDDGVKQLAYFRQRGALEWIQEIKMIAQMPHPLPKDKHDHLNQMLNEVWAVKLFAEHASSVEWIDWLEHEGHLKPLFETGTLNECALEFARLLENKYVSRHPEVIQLLFSRHHLRLNPTLWHGTVRKLCMSNPPPDNHAFCSWLTLLLSCKTEYKGPNILAWLAKRASELGLPLCLLDILSAMCKTELFLKPRFRLLDPDEGSPHGVDSTLNLHSDFGHLHDVWELIRPHLSQLAEPLAQMLISELERRFRMHVYTGEGNTHYDPDSMSRSAIEPHPQDKYPRPLHALIDALRDCVVHISQTHIEETLPLANRLARTKAPLLRRIGIHLLASSPNIGSEAKLKWLLESVSLDDMAAHHEIHMLLAGSFPKADEACRASVVNAVQELHTEMSDEGYKEHGEHFQYSLLAWLLQHGPDCESVQAALAEIQESHPSWKPSQHADFNHYTAGGWVQHKSPWTKDQLLGRPASDWVNELLAFQSAGRFEEGSGDTVVEISREGLWPALTQAADECSEWGIKLAYALIQRAEWKSDLWIGLMDSWEKWDGDITTVHATLEILTQSELLRAHPRRSARLLRAFVAALRKDGENRLIDELSVANHVSLSLWNVIPRQLDDEPPENDWVQFAINHPAGTLVEFWVHAHSHVRDSDSETEFLGFYEDAFRFVVEDESFVGGAGRATLFRFLSYLQNAMPQWVRDRLVPLLSEDDDSKFRQSWHGLLSGGQISEVLWAEIRDSVLNAASRLRSLEAQDGDGPSIHHFPEEFTDFYVDCVSGYESDPLNVWIPALYGKSQAEIHVQFARSVLSLLERGDEKERRGLWNSWLKEHWEKRLQGIPVALCPKESGAMLNWLLYLQFDFSAAVQIACRAPDFDLEHTHFFWDMGKSELPAKFPEDTARLLIHILELYEKSKKYTIWDLSPILVVLEPNLKLESTRVKLTELVVRCGFKWPEDNNPS